MALAGIGLYLIFKPKTNVISPTPGGGGEIGPVLPIIPEPIVPGLPEFKEPIKLLPILTDPIMDIIGISPIISEPSPIAPVKPIPVIDLPIIDNPITFPEPSPIFIKPTPVFDLPIIDNPIISPKPITPGDPGFIETWNGEIAIDDKKISPGDKNLNPGGGDVIPKLDILIGDLIGGGGNTSGGGGGGEMPGGGSTGGGTPSGGYIDVPPVFGGGDINITPGGGNIFDQPIIDNPTPVIVQPTPVYVEPAPVSSGGGETYNTPVYNEPSTNNNLLALERGGGESFWDSIRNSQWIQQIGGEEVIADPLSFDLIDRPLDQA